MRECPHGREPKTQQPHYQEEDPSLISLVRREVWSSSTRMDILSSAERSKRMALIRSRDTKPELRVRTTLRVMADSFRSHVSGLPGRPDFVLNRLKKAIFVRGCFWHGHKDCRNSRMPKSRIDYWRPKISGNQLRDRRRMTQLRRLGWSVAVIWECQTRDASSLRMRLEQFLTKPRDRPAPKKRRTNKS